MAMTNLREAAQMALHALQESKPIDIDDPAAFYRSAHAIEALRAALANEFNPDWDAMAVMVEEQQRMAKRIEELESALAQPEQEPVAWCFKESTGNLFGFTTELFDDEEQASNLVPLYTAPPQREWQGLTDEEMMVAAFQAGFDVHEDYDNEDDPDALHWWSEDGEPCDDTLHKLRDIIEAKLKEKNT